MDQRRDSVLEYCKWMCLSANGPDPKFKPSPGDSREADHLVGAAFGVDPST